VYELTVTMSELYILERTLRGYMNKFQDVMPKDTRIKHETLLGKINRKIERIK
jgi:hypothetical protein